MSNRIAKTFHHLLDLPTDDLADLIVEGQELQHEWAQQRGELTDKERRQIFMRSAGRSHHDATCKTILAERFGVQRGWKLATTPFGLDDLVHRRPQRIDHKQVIDHPYYYRTPKRPYRPAAIIGHEYHWEHGSIYYGEGYKAEIVDDYPAWHWPGHCTLVLVTPIDL